MNTHVLVIVGITIDMSPQTKTKEKLNEKDEWKIKHDQSINSMVGKTLMCLS